MPSGAERYKLHLGDALDILRVIDPGSVDAVITDPPYSSGGQFRGDRAQDPLAKYINSDTQREHRTFEGDGLDQRAWMRWCREWLHLCKRAMRRGGGVRLVH